MFFEENTHVIEILMSSLKTNLNYIDSISIQILCATTDRDKTLNQLLSEYCTKIFAYLEIKQFLRIYHQ